MAEKRTSVLKSLQGLVTSTKSRKQSQATNQAESHEKSDGKATETEMSGEMEQTEE